MLCFSITIIIEILVDTDGLHFSHHVQTASTPFQSFANAAKEFVI
jgi:hypothetical protein